MVLGHEQMEKFATWLNKRGEALSPLVVTFVALFLLAYFMDRPVVVGVAVALIALSPLWLPFFLGRYLWITWIHYIRFLFTATQPHVLLEIQLPPEVEKSPLSMEAFLAALWSTFGEATFYHRIWQGGYRPLWSLEIASNEGRVRFYLYLRESLKNTAEARLYGQFPEARVTVVEDYTYKVSFDPKEYILAGLEYRKMPNQPQALPIKTYIDYGLDKNPDTPETQVDPITHALELLGTAGPGEYIWTQIIMKARKKDEWYGIYKKQDKYVSEAKKAIQDIMKGAAERANAVLKDADIVEGKMNALLTDGEKKKIEAMERAMNKLIFECGIRSLYMAKKDRFDGSKFGGIITIFNPYRGPYHNALNPARGHTIFDFPWQDFRNMRKVFVGKKLFFRYRHRAYFYVPFDQTPIFMNVEELASLWHFPSSVVKTPSIERVPSRRAEAPTNLPTLPS